MNIRTLTKKLKAKFTFVGGEQHGFIKVGKKGLYGFVAVLFTFFGVNWLLGGLHSYA